MSQKEKNRKVRAILAGGLVLGVGAAVTLAAWNDSEFARGTFTSGGFNLVGSLDGTTFAEHPSSGTAAPLTFTVDASNIAPGDSVASAFAVRLAGTSTVDATVSLSSTTDNLNPGLTYSVKSTDGFDCSEAGNGVYTVGQTPIGSGAVAGTFDLLMGSGGSTPGGIVNLCFTVVAGAQENLTQNLTSVVTWQLAATEK
jgi:predicted ribosomally synthesized peptide with SipW-like signal peptide